MKQLGIRLDDELHKELKYLSIDLNISVNEYIVNLIKKDLAKRKKDK